MANTIKLFTGKVREKDGIITLIEREFIIPKNVVDASYFQLACTYHSLDLICLSYENQITDFEFNNVMSELTEELENEYSTLVYFKNDFSKKLMSISDSLMNKSSDLFETVINDTFAQYFCSSHLKVTTRKVVDVKENGDEFLKNEPLSIWKKWATANMDTKVLIEWVEDGKKPHSKNETFALFRNVLNELLSKTNEFYNSKNFDKMGENLIINHFLTTCKKDIASGKKGGFKQDYKSCQVLLQNLIKVGFLFLGCEEPEEKKKPSSTTLSLLALDNIKLPEEKTPDKEQETK